jgi:paraquat-inducible protein A
MTALRITACHECDLLQRLPSLPPGGTARCPRCGALLHRRRVDSLQRALALTLAGMMLFLVANSFPFLGFRLQAQVQETILVTGIYKLYSQGLAGLATLVLLTTVLFPAAQLAGLLYILVPLKLHRSPPGMAGVYRVVRALQPWSMMEVFMLGILVALVKLAKMATILPGISLFAFMALIFALAGVSAVLDPEGVWERISPRP